MREAEEKLFTVASKQMGLFTAHQAQEAGYDYRNFPYYLKTKKWLKEERGIYRLKNYPPSDFEIYMKWYLWSRDRSEIPLGVFSHETALQFFELSDWVPPKIHMSLPTKGRPLVKIPEGIIIYRQNLLSEEVTDFSGFKITTPLKTILNLIEEKTLSEEFIESAVKEAYKKGLLLASDFKKHPILGGYII